MGKTVVLGIFDKEETVIRGAKLLRDQGIPILDVYTPYPIHELEETMAIKRSRLPMVCFFAGLSGCTLALGFQIWAASVNWPINVGGKPFNSLPAFIPITFELTVLLGGLITTAAFLFRSKLFPLKVPVLFNDRISDDRFVIAVETPDISRVTDVMSVAGALVIERREEKVP